MTKTPALHALEQDEFLMGLEHDDFRDFVNWSGHVSKLLRDMHRNGVTSCDLLVLSEEIVEAMGQVYLQKSEENETNSPKFIKISVED